ncbi:hypothetical protein CHELA40_13957 [Chelatococcus asaccharovorans]|nr:hypothetical protein CHELA40_13957 [Chelatococcus asaccharovorans]CAH1674442.1 hypothetical protein CHELA17_61669 [Chelatococcus asaccharovorans]
MNFRAMWELVNGLGRDHAEARVERPQFECSLRARLINGPHRSTEHGVADVIARLGADPRGCAGIQLENAKDWLARRNKPLGERLGVLLDACDRAIFADEQHVEGQVGVAHPHGHGLHLLKVEEHAAIGRQIAPLHQTTASLRRGAHHLDGKGMSAARCGDREVLEPRLRIDKHDGIARMRLALRGRNPDERRQQRRDQQKLKGRSEPGEHDHETLLSQNAAMVAYAPVADKTPHLDRASLTITSQAQRDQRAVAHG